MALNQKQIEELKEKLMAEKERLETQIKNLDEHPDFGSDIDHLEEEADETEETANVLGTKNVLEKQLRNVDAALEKIGSDKFGTCEGCGKEIDFELLEADPESKLCRQCKSLIQKS